MIDDLIRGAHLITEHAEQVSRQLDPASRGWLLRPLEPLFAMLRDRGLIGRVLTGLLRLAIALAFLAAGMTIVLWGVFGSIFIFFAVAGWAGIGIGLVAGLGNATLAILVLAWLLHGLRADEETRDVFGRAQFADEIENIMAAGLTPRRRPGGPA
jgi:phosphotransferase system  glucose/maltose/N-acetylglucosamine-specific IIC component